MSDEKKDESKAPAKKRRVITGYRYTCKTKCFFDGHLRIVKQSYTFPEKLPKNVSPHFGPPTPEYSGPDEADD